MLVAVAVLLVGVGRGGLDESVRSVRKIFFVETGTGVGMAATEVSQPIIIISSMWM